MKVMLRCNQIGHLVVYVAKKDLEEEVVERVETDGNQIFTLTNGWQLQIAGLTEPLQLPQTVEAKRLS